MNFDLEQRFDAPIDQVESVLVDPQLVGRLRDAPGLHGAQLLHHSVDGVTVRREVRYTFSGNLPATVAAFADPARLTWVESSVIDRDTHRGEFSLVPDHYPELLQCKGTTELQATGTGSRRLICGELHVSVLVIGPQVAEAVVSGLREFWVAEERLIAQSLGVAVTASDEPADDATVPPMQDGGTSTEPEAATVTPPPGPDEPAARPTVTDQMIRVFTEQWRTVVEGVAGQVGQQLNAGLADMANQWKQTTEAFVSQLTQQWVEVQRTLEDRLRDAFVDPLAQLNPLARRPTAEEGSAPASEVSFAALLAPSVAQLNTVLADLTSQLNAQFDASSLTVTMQTPKDGGE